MSKFCNCGRPAASLIMLLDLLIAIPEDVSIETCFDNDDSKYESATWIKGKQWNLQHTLTSHKSSRYVYKLIWSRRVWFEYNPNRFGAAYSSCKTKLSTKADGVNFCYWNRACCADREMCLNFWECSGARWSTHYALRPAYEDPSNSFDRCSFRQWQSQEQLNNLK